MYTHGAMYKIMFIYIFIMYADIKQGEVRSSALLRHGEVLRNAFPLLLTRYGVSTQVGGVGQVNRPQQGHTAVNDLHFLYIYFWGSVFIFFFSGFQCHVSSLSVCLRNGSHLLSCRSSSKRAIVLSQNYKMI